MEKEEPIDVVITWVDGQDPMHTQKMLHYLKPEDRRADDIAGPTRYASNGEIYYCVAAVLRFAPFVRKIFIVTDNQSPVGLDRFVENNFPENKIPVEIIDHKLIFRGYEEYLPTFNATTIETVLYRIPDLSEHFVYLNDDFFLLRPVSPADWYREGKSIARGEWSNLIVGDLLSLLKPRKNGKRPLGFKDMMRATAHFLGYRWRYFHIQHNPHPLQKSVFERFFAEHENVLIDNLQYRFRDRKQIHPQTLFYLLGLASDKCVHQRDSAFYMKPAGRRKGYVDRKIRYFEKYRPDMVCIQSIDGASEADQAQIFDWLQRTIYIKFE